jgi:hypothetical protein
VALRPTGSSSERIYCARRRGAPQYAQPYAVGPPRLPIPPPPFCEPACQPPPGNAQHLRQDASPVVFPHHFDGRGQQLPEFWLVEWRFERVVGEYRYVAVKARGGVFGGGGQCGQHVRNSLVAFRCRLYYYGARELSLAAGCF